MFFEVGKCSQTLSKNISVAIFFPIALSFREFEVPFSIFQASLLSQEAMCQSCTISDKSRAS